LASNVKQHTAIVFMVRVCQKVDANATLDIQVPSVKLQLAMERLPPIQRFVVEKDPALAQINARVVQISRVQLATLQSAIQSQPQMPRSAVEEALALMLTTADVGMVSVASNAKLLEELVL